MKQTIYLVVTRYEVVKFRKTPGGTLKPGEREVKVNIDVDKTIFDNPAYEASMIVDPDRETELKILDQKLQRLKEKN